MSNKSKIILNFLSTIFDILLNKAYNILKMLLIMGIDDMITITQIKYEEGVLVLYSDEEVVHTEPIDEQEMVEDWLSELEEEGLIKIDLY